MARDTLARLILTGKTMDVVALQHIRVDTKLVLRGQQVDVMTTVVVIAEVGARIDCASRDLQRDPGNFQSGLTRHGRVD